MADENVFTDVDATLRALFETVEIDGSPVPVVLVTPDPDIVELTTPCITLMLSDVRRDETRRDNERRVEKDIDAMLADIKPPLAPYNLHYSVTGHGATTREDRLLLEEILLAVEENTLLVSADTQEEYRLGRDITFTEVSKGRDYGKTVGIVVKAWIEPRTVEQVPLVEETVFHVKRMELDSD